VLLRNLGEGRFRAITPQGGPYFQQDHNGRGVAFGDLDNDGRTDLVISHINEPVVILRNEAPTRNHWLGIALAGKDNRDVVGAKLTLEVGGRRLTRFAQGGGSYLSSSDRRHVFGLGGADKVGRLTVAWPWGKEEHWDGLAVDRYWRLEEGQGER
jgi:enediyne biosynthesis protein E4